jgi:hypothetical protein
MFDKNVATRFKKEQQQLSLVINIPTQSTTYKRNQPCYQALICCITRCYSQGTTPPLSQNY